MTSQIQSLRERIKVLETKMTILQDDIRHAHRIMQLLMNYTPHPLTVNRLSATAFDLYRNCHYMGAGEVRDCSGTQKADNDVCVNDQLIHTQESFQCLNSKCRCNSAPEFLRDVIQYFKTNRDNSLANENTQNCQMEKESESGQERSQTASNHFSFQQLEKKFGHAISSLQMPSLDQAQSNNKIDAEGEVRQHNFFPLPEKATALEVLHLWYSGTKDIPPIRQWTVTQKIPQKSKISRWKKIVDIFERKCDSDWQCFFDHYKDNQGKLLPISSILSLYNYEQAQKDNCLFMNTDQLEEDSLGSNKGHNASEAPSSFPYCNTNQVSKSPAIKLSYVLPKKIKGQKVSPVDIIKIWEKGIAGRIPPIKTWTSIQKLTQQSKVSRWKKIYLIYKKQCNGDMDKFKQLVTDSSGKTMSVATVCKLYCQF